MFSILFPYPAQGLAFLFPITKLPTDLSLSRDFLIMYILFPALKDTVSSSSFFNASSNWASEVIFFATKQSSLCRAVTLFQLLLSGGVAAGRFATYFLRNSFNSLNNV